MLTPRERFITARERRPLTGRPLLMTAFERVRATVAGQPVDHLVAQARQDLGAGRVISGNISTVTDLMTGTPEDVSRAAERCHRLSGRYHIVNSGCEVSPLTPPDNLRALVRYAKEHS